MVAGPDRLQPMEQSMHVTLSLILMVAAFVLFVIAAIPVASRFNLIAAGLACWVLAVLTGGVALS